MDIKILRYFLQICKDGSFSKAAKNLYISQQGLSKSISNLEKEIGVSVFNRTSKGNELTEYGEYLKNKASTIVYQFDILTEGINEIKQKNKKFLNIGVPFGVINSLSFDLINEFNKIYPDIILNIKEYTDSKCEEAILNGDVDLGFVIAHFDKNKFDYKLIKHEKLYAIVNKNHKLANHDFIDFLDLKNEKIIINSTESKVHHNFIIKCLENGFDPHILIRTNEMILVTDFSKRNEGIGISIHFSHTPNCKINYIPFKDESFTWDIYMVTKKNTIIDDTMKKFMDFIEDNSIARNNLILKEDVI